MISNTLKFESRTKRLTPRRRGEICAGIDTACHTQASIHAAGGSCFCNAAVAACFYYCCCRCCCLLLLSYIAPLAVSHDTIMLLPRWVRLSSFCCSKYRARVAKLTPVTRPQCQRGRILRMTSLIVDRFVGNLVNFLTALSNKSCVRHGISRSNPSATAFLAAGYMAFNGIQTGTKVELPARMWEIHLCVHVCARHMWHSLRTLVSASSFISAGSLLKRARGGDLYVHTGLIEAFCDEQYVTLQERNRALHLLHQTVWLNAVCATV